MTGVIAGEEYPAVVDQAADAFLQAAHLPAPPRDAMLRALNDVCREAFDDGEEGRHLKTRPLEPADKSRVDQALRRAIVKLSTSAADAGVPIMRWRQDGASSADGALPGLLQMLLAVWAEPALEPAVILHTLEICLEISTIEECGDIFAWIEAHIGQLEGPSVKTLTNIALKMCNNLLRRLSKAQNTVLCGRISLFLARFLPLDDRSGLNLPAAVNTSNTTPIEDPEQVTVDSNGDPVDVEFYSSFWGLQRTFQAPYDAMSPASWSAAVKTIQGVLKRFKQGSVAVAASAQPSAGARGASAAVKYLSSSKLLKLQLQDAGLRRHFLLQVLIFLHAVRHVGKLPVKAAAPALKDRQAEEADAVETATYEALAATPERGAEFAAAVRSVLADETHWVAWKKTPAPDRLAGKPQFCASFQRPPYTEPETLRKVRSKRPGDVPQPPASKRKRARTEADGAHIDDGPLDHLFNLAKSNLDGLEVAVRKHRPTVLDFMQPLVDQTVPGTVEEEYMIKNNPVYRWKLLRILARQHISTFAKAAAANDVEQAARELFPEKCAPKPEAEADPAPEAEPEAKPEQSTAAEPMETAVNTPEPQLNGKADMQTDKPAEDVDGGTAADADNAATAEPAETVAVADTEMPAA